MTSMTPAMKAEAFQRSLRRRRALECLILFAFVPLIVVYFEQKRALLGLIWIAAIYCIGVMRKHYGFSLRAEWNARAVTPAALVPLLVRFALSALVLTAFTWQVEPGQLFRFPLYLTSVWLFVMVAYPLLSVLPQEIIFRCFFFRRYATIMPGERSLAALSALAFGFAHVILSNWVALGLSIVGGWLFATTYQRHRSLALVCLEHALYGCFVFTVGLGMYFYSGAPGRFHWSG